MLQSQRLILIVILLDMVTGLSIGASAVNGFTNPDTPGNDIIEYGYNYQTYLNDSTTRSVIRTGSQLQEQTYGNQLALSNSIYDIFTGTRIQSPYNPEDAWTIPEILLITGITIFLILLNTLAGYEMYLVIKNQKTS